MLFFITAVGTLLAGVALAIFEYKENKMGMCVVGIILAVGGFIGTVVAFQAPSVELYPSDGIVSPNGEVTLKTGFGFDVYYTLEADEDPSENGILYKDPIKVEKDTVLNAKSNFWTFWSALDSWVLLVDSSGGVTSTKADAPLEENAAIDLDVKYLGNNIKLGEDVDRDDFRVIEVLADGTRSEIYDFAIDDSDLTEPGVRNVKISNGPIVKSCNVKVIGPTRIEATFQGKSVEIGDTISNEMFLVNVIYSDGSKEEVNEFTISPNEFADPGEHDVSIEHEGMQTTCSITVEEEFDYTVWESHTPDDVATSVSMVAWDPNNDYGINGKRYSGGQKITVSNWFSSLGSNGENEVESTFFLPVRNSNEEDTLEGWIVLDKSMLNSSSHGTISIEVDGQELFTTGDIGADDQDAFLVKVPFKNVDSIKLITRAGLNGSDFVYGFVSLE